MLTWILAVMALTPPVGLAALAVIERALSAPDDYLFFSGLVFYILILIMLSSYALGFAS